jgi:hypothetical protein
MIWVGFSVMIGTIIVSLALLRSDRGDALGIPLVAIGSFAFLYVIQPLQLILTGSSDLFLTQWQFAEGLLVPAVMLAFFMWGWLHPSRRSPRAVAPWDPRAMWNAGFWVGSVGLILYAIFIERSGGVAHAFSEAHGHAMAYQTNTAYLIEGPWLMLSGSAIMILSAARSRSQQRWRRHAPYLFFSIYLLISVFTGSRGGIFAVSTSFFVARSIAQGKNVSFGKATRILLPIGVLVMLMVGYRSVLHLGPQTSEELPSLESSYQDVAGVSEYDKTHNTASQEFLVHAATLSTVDETGKLDYGLSWAWLLVINPIPRLVWPEKHYPPPTGVTWSDIYEHTGIGINFGSASGIVADLYGCFHIFSAIFFFAFGKCLRRLFVAARSLGSPLAAVAYVMMYALSLNIFAQGFATFFVPLGYSIAPLAVFAWATRRSERKARVRQSGMILRRAEDLHVEQWSP